MRRLKLAVLGGVIAAMGTVGMVSGGHTVTANDHGTIAGNPKCSDYGSWAFSLKLEAGVNLANGTFGPIVISNYNGTRLDWAIAAAYLHTYDANLVIVKGGPNAEVYEYDTFDDWDQGLTAPVNPNNNKYYGISHVSFCFDPKA
jgi:hypothetical protein